MSTALLKSPKSRLSIVRRYRVGVVVPAFNEASNLKSVLQDLSTLKRTQSEWDFQVVVVNDGSTDETAQVLEECSSVFDFHVIHHKINLGIGRAVQSGLLWGLSRDVDCVIQVDGDGQHPANFIPEVLGPLFRGEADMAVGSRYLPGSEFNVSTEFRQRGTQAFSLLLRWLVGVRIHDVTSGFRAYSRDALRAIAAKYPDDYPEVEVFVPIARAGYRIREVPVKMKTRQGGASSITPWRSVYYVIKVTFATWIQAIRSREGSGS